MFHHRHRRRRLPDTTTDNIKIMFVCKLCGVENKIQRLCPIKSTERHCEITSWRATVGFLTKKEQSRVGVCMCACVRACLCIYHVVPFFSSVRWLEMKRTIFNLKWCFEPISTLILYTNVFIFPTSKRWYNAANSIQNAFSSFSIHFVNSLFCQFFSLVPLFRRSLFLLLTRSLFSNFTSHLSRLIWA